MGVIRAEKGSTTVEEAEDEVLELDEANDDGADAAADADAVAAVGGEMGLWPFIAVQMRKMITKVWYRVDEDFVLVVRRTVYLWLWMM